jgi:hypothetical protein
MLDDVASIASYLVANSDACDALVSSLVPGGFTTGDGPVAALPLSRQLAEALAGDGKDTEKLRRAINAGLAKGVQLASERSTAYHEAGHAVVSAILRPALMVTKVTIVPDEKNSSAGTTWFDPESAYWERDWTQRNFQSSLCVLMAGRAAEIIKLGPDQASTGALSDIANATEGSWRCITETGLDEEFGPISLSTIAKQSGQSGGWAFDLAQRRVHHVLREAAARADAILRANWTAVEQVASALLEHKTLDDTMFLSTLVRKSLEGIPGVVRATSRPVRRNIVFATRPGTIDTAEGPVRHRKGDAIITGAEGERWPASRSYVDARYIPVDGGQMGTDGVYEKIPHVVRALRLMQPGRVDLLGAMGILSGEAGDWIVDYGEGDVALVGRSKFPALYEVEG